MNYMLKIGSHFACNIEMVHREQQVRGSSPQKALKK
jgi:hypothetical protein